MSTHIILKKFFDLKKSKNEMYSVRAFARDLGVSHTYVSRLLSGQRTLSKKRLEEVCSVLEIDDVGRAQLEKMIANAEKNKEESSVEKKDLNLEKTFDYQEISPQDMLSLFEEWYYIATLTLVSCEEFDATPEFISQRLGVSLNEAQKSWNKLQELDLVEEENGRWRRKEIHQRHLSKGPSWQKRKYYSQHLKKSNEVLQSSPSQEEFELRLFNGATVATDDASIRKVRKLLSQTLAETARILSEGKPEKVYQLSIQLNSLEK